MLQQRLLLIGSGLKPEPYATRLWTTTDIPRRERRFRLSLKAEASTPRSR
jgi:hypothetical protein